MRKEREGASKESRRSRALRAGVGKTRYSRSTASEGGIKPQKGWTTVISRRKKNRLFSHETVQLHGSTLYFALCTFAYLITSGCCSACTDTPSSGAKSGNPCIRTQQQYSPGARASHHRSRQLSQSFSQGKSRTSAILLFL